MKKFIEHLKHFLKGWKKDSVRELPETFWQYFIYYPINWSWTLGSLLFIGLFLYGEHKYQAPIFYFMALIPFLMLVYNLIDEYNAYLYKKNGVRNIGAKRLMYIFYGASLVILLLLIAVLILK